MTISCSIRSQHFDKTGVPFDVGLCDDEHCQALLEMYYNFHPKAESQGLPPAHEEDRRRWVVDLLKVGRNIVAWSEGQIVGHCALIPDMDRRDAEYIIFVNQNFRNRGLGTVLTTVAIRTAREMELERIWLTVESYNFRAILLYRKVGFVFRDSGERERTMVLVL